MTNQEIARALEDLIREDGKRPPAEQVRDLTEAGIIDEHGRLLIGEIGKTDRRNERATRSP